MDELSYMAARAGAPDALVRDDAAEMVDLFHQVWASERPHLPISEDLAAEVDRLLRVVHLAAA
jgi:serine/threonine-protein kinase HipA